MSLWFEIIVIAFLVLITDRLFALQHTLLKFAIRMEQALQDYEKRNSDSIPADD
jgi:hypothetical protein